MTDSSTDNSDEKHSLLDSHTVYNSVDETFQALLTDFEVRPIFRVKNVIKSSKSEDSSSEETILHTEQLDYTVDINKNKATVQGKEVDIITKESLNDYTFLTSVDQLYTAESLPFTFIVEYKPENQSDSTIHIEWELIEYELLATLKSEKFIEDKTVSVENFKSIEALNSVDPSIEDLQKQIHCYINSSNVIQTNPDLPDVRHVNSLVYSIVSTGFTVSVTIMLYYLIHTYLPNSPLSVILPTLFIGYISAEFILSKQNLVRSNLQKSKYRRLPVIENDIPDEAVSLSKLFELQQEEEEEESVYTEEVTITLEDDTLYAHNRDISWDISTEKDTQYSEKAVEFFVQYGLERSIDSFEAVIIEKEEIEYNDEFGLVSENEKWVLIPATTDIDTIKQDTTTIAKIFN